MEGRENIPDEGSFLFVCNHQSFFDPIFCGVAIKRQLHFLARDTLFKGSFGKLITAVDAIPVKRGQSDLKAIRTVINELKKGHGVCLYPEATRTSDGRIREFKLGLGLLCRRGKTGVIPVNIEGAYEIWSRHEKFPSFFKPVRVKIGEMIPAEQIKNMEADELAEQLTATVRKMQNENRKKMKKEVINYDASDQ